MIDDYGKTIVSIGQLDLESDKRNIRMNLRNAWLAASVADIRKEAMRWAAQGKWFEAAVLLELALD